MSHRSSTRPRSVGLAAGLSATVVAAGLSAAPAPAGAATGVVPYACTAEGVDPFTMPVDTDSLASWRTYAGDPVPVVSALTLPPEVARRASEAGATGLQGTVAQAVSDGSTPVTLAESVPLTPLGDQSSPTGAAVPFSAATPAGTGFVPSTPGDPVLTAGSLTAALQLVDPAGVSVATLDAACTPPNGQVPAIDALTVASRTATAVALTTPRATYGQDVTASGTVSAAAGAATGDVAMVVDGVASRVALPTTGTSTLLLRRLGVGAHEVFATFLPDDNLHYDGSTSGVATVEVVPAATRTRVRVAGARVGRTARARVRVGAEFGTVPAGRVKVVLDERGVRTHVRVRVRSLAGGTVRVRLGRLRPGRYTLRAAYRGDRNHTRSSTVRTFRVRRR